MPEQSAMLALASLLVAMAVAMGVMAKFIMGLLKWCREQQVEIDKLRDDAKTAWEFQVRRAYAEAVQKGMAVVVPKGP